MSFTIKYFPYLHEIKISNIRGTHLVTRIWQNNCEKKCNRNQWFLFMSQMLLTIAQLLVMVKLTEITGYCRRPQKHCDICIAIVHKSHRLVVCAIRRRKWRRLDTGSFSWTTCLNATKHGALYLRWCVPKFPPIKLNVLSFDKPYQ